ncbi:MAG: hypothetical protein JWL83_716 [Actinomycetia bacterium]|nr:hypothetical protein [Actinomycetes bacterium]
MRHALTAEPCIGGIAVLAAVSGVVWAVVRAARIGWVPGADDAAIALRTQDVFSRHLPLLGMPSTLGVYAHGHPASHPGPLEFFALASPYALFGRSPAGLLVGVAIVNVASILAIAWACSRLGGWRLVTWSMLMTAILVWAIGTAAAEVWNPDIALLPFAAFLVLGATVANGAVSALPLAVLFGSFALQAHLSYLGLVALVTGWIVVVALWHGVRQWRADPTSRRGLQRVAVASTAVFVACWWAPVVQQFAGHPPNVSALLGGLTAGGSHVAGPRFAVHFVGRVIGVPPPFGMRPTNADTGMVGVASPADWARFALPWLLLALGFAVAFRRRSKLAAVTLATAAVSVGAATITAARVPSLETAGLVYIYNVRWLWPTAMFFWFAIVFATWQLIAVPDRTGRVLPRWPAVLCVGLAVVVASVPRVSATTVARADARLTRLLADSLTARVAGSGPLVVRGSGATAVVTVAPGLAVALERHGVHAYLLPPFPPPIAPWGNHREYTGQPVAGTVWVVSGGSGAPTPTARRVASASGVTGAVAREGRRLRDAMLADINREGGVRLTDAGRHLLANTSREAGRTIRTDLLAARDKPRAALSDGTLSTLVGDGLIAAPGGDPTALKRYGALRPLLSGEWNATVYLDRPPT